LRIRAVGNVYGPTDLRDPAEWTQVRNLVEALVGGTLEDSKEALADASPLTHLDRCDAPVLTIHGTADPIVHFSQAKALEAALAKLQIPGTLVPLEGAGHGLGSHGEKARGRISDFFDAYLRGSEMPLVVREDFDHGIAHWQPTDAAAWEARSKDGRSWYALIKDKSDYEPKVRSPYNISLLKDVEVSDFELDVDLRSTKAPYPHQSLCLFFGYQDPSHFYYVHFGRNADPHANSIFLVNDEPRVSIAKERTDGTDWSRGWHRARIRRDVTSGTIEVFFDDMQKPVMTTVDKTFASGRVGIGSFDDIGDFDSFRLRGRVVGGSAAKD
jgi:hypothetical protein